MDQIRRAGCTLQWQAVFDRRKVTYDLTLMRALRGNSSTPFCQRRKCARIRLEPDNFKAVSIAVKNSTPASNPMSTMRAPVPVAFLCSKGGSCIFDHPERSSFRSGKTNRGLLFFSVSSPSFSSVVLAASGAVV
mmetsp:Transcript_8309/g.20798  ORF Transcript_8309/g.20798 Transcript_8309/m.20798 type:complete len:134 (+) Transcript_8309:634-1035(+)